MQTTSKSKTYSALFEESLTHAKQDNLIYKESIIDFIVLTNITILLKIAFKKVFGFKLCNLICYLILHGKNRNKHFTANNCPYSPESRRGKNRRAKYSLQSLRLFMTV